MKVKSIFIALFLFSFILTSDIDFPFSSDLSSQINAKEVLVSQEKQFPFDQEIQISQQENLPVSQQEKLNNLLLEANKYIKTSRWALAASSLEQALTISKQIGDRNSEREITLALSRVYGANRQMDKWYAVYQQCDFDFCVQNLSSQQQASYQFVELISLANKANIQMYSNNYKGALETVNILLAHSISKNYSPMESLAYFHLAFIEMLSGNYTTSINYLDLALNSLNKQNSSQFGSGIPDMKEVVNLFYANNYYQLGDYQKSRSYLETLSNNSASEQGKKQLLASIDLATGKYKEAIKKTDNLLPSIDKSSPQNLYPTLLAIKGEAYFKLGEYQKSERLLRESLEQIEVTRNQSEATGLDLALIPYFEQETWISQILTQLLVKQKQYGKALEASEMGKARVTSAIMQRDNSAGASNSTNPECGQLVMQLSTASLADLKKMRDNLGFMGNLPNMPNIPGQSSSCDYLTAINLAISQKSKQQIPPIQPPSIEKIKQVAREQNATIIEYSIISKQAFGKLTRTEDELYIWVVKPNGEIIFKQVTLSSENLNLNSSTAISNLVYNWRCFENEACKVEENAPLNRSDRFFDIDNQNTQITEETTSLAEKTSSQDELKKLYQLLIEPIKDNLPAKNNLIVIIPDKSLFVIPFSALIDSNGKYLIENYSLSTSPSIETHSLAIQKSKPFDLASVSGTNALIIGNPEMPSIGNETPVKLYPLPGAEREAKAIANLFNSEAIINSSATKNFVLSRINDASIVHLATHGVLEDITDVGIPGALAFTPDNNTNNSGWLRADEIMDLSMNSQLTVLSACNTGNGVIKGDGIIGLSRSFIIAGSPSVVVSLWKVPDKPTEILMTNFYQELKNGQSKDVALRQAMLKTMKEYKDPRNWAAFILIGDNTVKGNNLLTRKSEDASNLIINGSFEEGNFNPTNNSWKRIGKDQNDIIGWKVGGNAVDWHNSLEFKFPQDGNLLIDLNLGGGGVSDTGSISQTFETRVGQTYNLTFYLAGSNFFTNPRQVQVDIAGISKVFNVTTSSNTDLVWEEKKLSFKAVKPVTTLTFSSPDGSGFWGALIDNISVKPSRSSNDS